MEISQMSLHGWPTTVNCVAWSTHYELAVAIEERVHVFSPRLRAAFEHADAQEDGEIVWDRVDLIVNTFDPSVLPVITPKPDHALSIGEEQASGSVVALAWSPAGLARNRKCALAVLTNSRILSIWASSSDMSDVASWRRVLIVNLALHRYFESSSSEPSVRTRPAVFCWAPPVSNAVASATSGVDHVGNNPSYPMAIVNDTGDFIVIEMSSPTRDPSSDRGDWLAKVIHCVEGQSAAADQPISPVDANSLLANMAPLSIVWSPWLFENTLEDSGFSSIVAYILSSKLVIRCCWLPNTTASKGVHILHDHKIIEGNWCGPLHVSFTKEEHNKCIHIAVFDIEEVFCFSLPYQDGFLTLEALEIVKEERHQNWDIVAGCGLVRTNFSTVLGFLPHYYLKGKPTLVQWPLSQDRPEYEGHWKESLEDTLAQFREENDKDIESVARIWGFTSTSEENYTALCFSTHPHDIIQYAQPHEKESSLIINASTATPVLNIEYHSSEALCFDFLSRRSQNTVQSLRSFLQQATSIQDTDRTSGLVNSVQQLKSASDVILYIKSTIHAFDHLRRQLLSVCQDTQTKGNDATELEFAEIDRDVTQSFCSTILQIDSTLYKNNLFGSQLLLNYKLRLSNAVDKASPTRVDVDPDMAISQSPQRCDLCDSDIPFESMHWAQCARGHQFRRCSLTLFAVQSPGISTHCNLCGRECLQGDFLRLCDRGNDMTVLQAPDLASRPPLDSQPTLSLIEIILIACDTCIYCGGKFVG